MTITLLINRLRTEMPPVFTRKMACKFLGGLLSPGTLANLDSTGIGPMGIRTGKSILYERESFLEWLQNRISGGRTNG